MFGEERVVRATRTQYSLFSLTSETNWWEAVLELSNLYFF